MLLTVVFVALLVSLVVFLNVRLSKRQDSMVSIWKDLGDLKDQIEEEERRIQKEHDAE